MLLFRPCQTKTNPRGGQDIAVNGTNAMNNGDPFDDAHPIVLKNRQQLGRDAQGNLQPTQADGSILLREPKAIVSDIIIDNWNSGTSPGSRSPSETSAMSGFTHATSCDQGGDYFTVRCAVYANPNTSPPDTTYLSPPFATAGGGTSATARYVPAIGVAGGSTRCLNGTVP